MLICYPTNLVSVQILDQAGDHSFALLFAHETNLHKGQLCGCASIGHISIPAIANRIDQQSRAFLGYNVEDKFYRQVHPSWSTISIMNINGYGSPERNGDLHNDIILENPTGQQYLYHQHSVNYLSSQNKTCNSNTQGLVLQKPLS